MPTQHTEQSTGNSFDNLKVPQREKEITIKGYLESAIGKDIHAQIQNRYVEGKILSVIGNPDTPTIIIGDPNNFSMVSFQQISFLTVGDVIEKPYKPTWEGVFTKEERSENYTLPKQPDWNNQSLMARPSHALMHTKNKT